MRSAPATKQNRVHDARRSQLAPLNPSSKNDSGLTREWTNGGVTRTGAARARMPGKHRGLGGRALKETSSFRLHHHVQRVDTALAKVKRTLEPFARATARPAEGEALSSHRQRTWRQRTRAFARAMDAFEQSRRSLLSNRSALEHDSWLRKYGDDNPEVQGTQNLSEPQLKALEMFLRRFSSENGLNLQAEVLDKNVSPASAHVLMALSGAIRSLHASIDPSGAANIDHLATVYKGVLEQENKLLQRPLTQNEADKLAFNTVCTDIWMKGQSLEVLSSIQTAPTNAGSTGAEIYSHMKQSVRSRFEDLEPQIKKLVGAWIDRGFIPMDPQSVAREADEAKLTGAQKEKLKDIWGARIMGSGDFFNVQSFMLGVWLHGLPSFDSVKHTVDSSGKGRTSPQDVYFAVLGHHMAGFIAAGFARGSVDVNFQGMEARGELPSGAASKLTRLYQSSVALASKWRAVIDRKKILSTDERAEYRKDARQLREAINRLPESVRAQLMNDDEMQFTPIGIEKWLKMAKGDSQGQTIADLYNGPVQAYYEEQLARDISLKPGEQFELRCAEVMSKLGVHLDEKTKCFRLANPGEPEYLTHAQSILADPGLRAEFTESSGSQAHERSPPDSDVVEWFRACTIDSKTLVRLAQS